MPNRSSLCLQTTLVRDRQVSPVELVEAHLKQIRALNPKINAFVRVFDEEARAEARRAEAAGSRGDAPGLLHGVPVTVKDSFDMAGQPTLCGSVFRRDHRAAEDAAAVARLRAAGAIILGKTNCPEFLLNYETDNFVAGRTNNPWNLERTPGGSSGGESAAIASFCSAGGIGSDGGGSVRIPAAFCGIVGLKPTPGRISAAGHFPVISHPGGLLGVAGPMARSAEDVRLLFAALAGYDSQDPFSSPVPLRTPSLKGCRVGFVEQFYKVPVQPAVRQKVRDAARVLSDMNIEVDEFVPRGLERAPNVWWFFFGHLPARTVQQLSQGREDEAHWTSTDFLNKALAEPAPTVEQVLTNFAIRDRMRADLIRQMEKFPVLLWPVCAVTAFPHRTRKWQIAGQQIGLFQAMMTVTPFNLLGFPSVVIPFGVDEEGMPVGVQIVGRPYEEELILEIAVRMEESRGPFPGPRGV